MKKLSNHLKRFPWWHEAVLVLLLVGLLIAAGIAMPRFLNAGRQLMLSRHLWEMAILSLGMTLIILTGGIDLSVGSCMGLCAISFGCCFSATESLWLSCAASLATGIAGGAVNGALITKVKVHPLIVTLATYAAFRGMAGMAEGISQGASYSKFGDSFSQLARGYLFGVPIPAYVFAVLAILGAVFLAKTPSGRFIYAIGHNETAARFSGVAVDRIKFCLYTLSGLLAGLASIIYVARFDSAKANVGTGFELDAITAVVVGGTSIFGGRGNIGGTVLGLLLIHETRLFVGSYWRIEELKSILVGCLLLVSILAYRALMSRERK